MIGIQPLFNRLLVKRKRIEKIGAIYTPENSQEARPGIGEVIAIGPDCDVVKVGQIVLFGRYAPYNIDKRELKIAGIEMTDSTDEFALCNEEDLLATAENVFAN